jgi:hypothetical protein
MGVIVIFLLNRKRSIGINPISNESPPLIDESNLTAIEIQKLEDYMDKKYHYYKWKFFIDYQLYYFSKVRLNPEVKESIPKMEIQKIGKPIEDDTFFKLKALKVNLKKMIIKYNSNLNVDSSTDIKEYLTLAEKAISGKAHKEVLEIFKPFIQSKEEHETWKSLYESEPKV